MSGEFQQSPSKNAGGMSYESDHGNDDLNDAALALLMLATTPTSSSNRTRPNSPISKITMPPSLPFAQDQAQPLPLPPLVLVDNLIFDILTRLPVKSLVRLRCVCKAWNILISNPLFVKNHLDRSIKDTTLTHHRFLLLTRHPGCHLISCSLQSLFNNPSTPVIDFDVASNFPFPLNFGDINGSCNGLLCLGPFGDGCFLLWNPCTRLRSQESPSLDLGDKYVALYGFGHDNLSDKYKLVAFLSDSIHKTGFKVYTFGSDSWRTIQSSPTVPSHPHAEYVSGTLNWLAEAHHDNLAFKQRVIVSLDLGNETCREFLLPQLLDEMYDWPMLGVLKGYLSFYVFTGADLVVWQMKHYGVEESWIKLCTIIHLDLQRPEIEYEIPFTLPLCMSENGKFLVETTFCGTVLYNSKDATYEYPEIEGVEDWSYQLIYIESLVSPLF